MAKKYFKSEIGKFISNGRGQTFTFIHEVMAVDGDDTVLVDMLEKAMRVEEVDGKGEVANTEDGDAPVDPTKMNKPELLELIANAGGEVVGNETKSELIDLFNSL